VINYITFPSRKLCCKQPVIINCFLQIVWIEHVELEDNEVHDLYKSYVDSGFAFGAKRWVASLDRQCERLASAMATNLPHASVGGIMILLHFFFSF